MQARARSRARVGRTGVGTGKGKGGKVKGTKGISTVKTKTVIEAMLRVVSDVSSNADTSQNHGDHVVDRAR